MATVEVAHENKNENENENDLPPTALDTYIVQAVVGRSEAPPPSTIT